MSSKEILIISSSPPKHFTTYSMSPSPVLPSPSEVFAKNVPVLQTGARATPFAGKLNASFTGASNIFQSGSLQDIGTIRTINPGPKNDDMFESRKSKNVAKTSSRKPASNKRNGTENLVVKRPRKTVAKRIEAGIDGLENKKVRKPRTEKSDEGDGQVSIQEQKVPRKSRAKKDETSGDKTGPKPRRKPRSKKAEADAQTKLPKSQVTKASVSLAKDQCMKSRRQHGTTGVDPCVDPLDHGLAQAVKRRAHWTPPPPVKTVSLKTPGSVYLLDEGLTSWSSKGLEKGNGFQDFLGSFGFSRVEVATAAGNVPVVAGTKKRKLIELVKTNVAASIVAPKTKPPRKKPKTITEQATSIYAEKDENLEDAASLLQYFSLGPNDKATSDGFKAPPRPRSKSPIKRGKGTSQAPILLSPESALKQAGNQDFVFGTSSQLAREESPGFLRDIHTAMQASNELDNDNLSASPTRPGGKSKLIQSLKSNLWSAAARDDSGQLLEVEIADLVDSPSMPQLVHKAASPKCAPLRPCRDDNERWLDIEEMAEQPVETKIIEDSLHRVGPLERAIRLELLNKPSTSIQTFELPATIAGQSKPPIPKLSAKLQASKDKMNNGKDPKRPDFSAYTKAQLMKEIASYHFKPVKSREQMIILLERCWDAKQHRSALANLGTNLPISDPKQSASVFPTSSHLGTMSPKRPRGRPRKDSSATPSPKRKTKTASLANAFSRARKAQKKVEALDEISDSDTAQTPSPPRRHPSQFGTPPLPLQLSSSSSFDSQELSPTSSQNRLFKHITAAVRHSTPATDSSNPSWYEKMLLYDPIVIEDLTGWLNTGALEKVGWDGEVDPKEVKKWCQNKSICCLWKENLRGGSRSRY